MTPDQIGVLSEVLRGAPVALILALALIGAVREWWVAGPMHRRLLDASEAREREWRGLALEATGLAEKAVDVAGRRGRGS